MNQKSLLILAVVALSASFVLMTDDADSGTSDSVLIDMGNGVTYWCDCDVTGDSASVLKAAAEKLGLELTASGGTVSSVGGMENHMVGQQQCSWRAYYWNGEAWDASSSSGKYLAWGFYPDASITPVETPDEPTAWTMHRGDSESSGDSDSYGTEIVRTPLEWYRSYTTGYVDSSIICAGDLLYHTTGGTYGATGSDGSPWIYCVNRYTGEPVWDYMMTRGQGYEVTSPLVIGDMLIVTATNWNVYCLDRFTGDLLYKMTLPQEYEYNSEGDVVWEGRTFFTGATTPVYDSGAFYFGTADGHVMAYTVTRDSGFKLLWDYFPPATCKDGKYTGVRGCFYFHAPVIADVNGQRMLFIGSYEGYVHALDASSGREIWVERMINLGNDNIPHKGTPGSCANITYLPNGTLLVCCTDGGLSPQTGYTVCVDAATGKGTNGGDYIWKLDVMTGGPVASGDRFYSYVSPTVNSPSSIKKADGSEITISDAVYCFNMSGEVVWVSGEYQLIKGALTLADGVIYMTDYSAGIFYPNGGGLTAISADDGSQFWRVKLVPYSADSYSMVAPTVIDGKVYTGNDYGAIYCVSEVAGKDYGDDGEIVLENGLYHWSWIALIIAIMACLYFLIKFY